MTVFSNWRAPGRLHRSSNQWTPQHTLQECELQARQQHERVLLNVQPEETAHRRCAFTTNSVSRHRNVATAVAIVPRTCYQLQSYGLSSAKIIPSKTSPSYWTRNSGFENVGNAMAAMRNEGHPQSHPTNLLILSAVKIYCQREKPDLHCSFHRIGSGPQRSTKDQEIRHAILDVIQKMLQETSLRLLQSSIKNTYPS